MTTLTLVSDDSVTTDVGEIVYAAVTVDDDTVPVFRTSEGRRLAGSRDELGIWTARWATERGGAFAISVTAGAASPVMMIVTVEDGAPDPPTPGASFVDDAVTALWADESSDFREAVEAGLTASFAYPEDAYVVHVSPAGSDTNARGIALGAPMQTIAAAQEALRDLSGVTRPTSVFLLYPGTFEVTEKVTVHSRQQLRAVVGPGPGNTDFQKGVTIKAAAGFTDDNVIESESWTVPTEYAHGTVLEGFTVDGNKAAGNTCNGIGINGLGEESVLRRTRVVNAGGKAYALVGTHAVGHVEDISGWDCAGGNLYIGPHPDAVPNGGEAVAGSTGSVRVYGISGDGNGLFQVKIDGSYSVDINIKHEKRIDSADAGVIITDTDTVAVLGLAACTLGRRAKVRIAGRSDPAAGPGAVTGGDFVRIEGTAKPSVQLDTLLAPNWTNTIHDLVTSFTLPSVGGTNVGFIYYCADTNDRFRVVSRTAKMPPIDVFDYQTTGVHMRGRDLADTASTWQVLPTGEANYPTVTGMAAGSELVLGKSGDTAAVRFLRPVTISDAKHVTVSGTTGTKIGTGTTQKLGFWNATPVVQPAAVADATDAATAITQLNALLARLRAAGIIAT